MNSNQVKQEITNIIEQLHNRIGGKAARKQYTVAKWQIATLTELGIIDLMPAGFGHSDANAVIEAAKDGGKWVGEGDQVTATEPSELNKLLNEVVVEPAKPEIENNHTYKVESSFLLEGEAIIGYAGDTFTVLDKSHVRPAAPYKAAFEVVLFEVNVYPTNFKINRWVSQELFVNWLIRGEIK